MDPQEESYIAFAGSWQELSEDTEEECSFNKTGVGRYILPKYQRYKTQRKRFRAKEL
jgi:hypothetical protein